MSSATDQLVDKRREKQKGVTVQPVCMHSGGKLKQHCGTTSSTPEVHEVKPPQAEMHLSNNKKLLQVLLELYMLPHLKKKRKGK